MMNSTRSRGAQKDGAGLVVRWTAFPCSCCTIPLDTKAEPSTPAQMFTRIQQRYNNQQDCCCNQVKALVPFPCANTARAAIDHVLKLKPAESRGRSYHSCNSHLERRHVIMQQLQYHDNIRCRQLWHHSQGAARAAT